MGDRIMKSNLASSIFDEKLLIHTKIPINAQNQDTALTNTNLFLPAASLIP